MATCLAPPGAMVALFLFGQTFSERGNGDFFSPSGPLNLSYELPQVTHPGFLFETVGEYHLVCRWHFIYWSLGGYENPVYMLGGAFGTVKV